MYLLLFYTIGGGGFFLNSILHPSLILYDDIGRLANGTI